MKNIKLEIDKCEEEILLAEEGIKGTQKFLKEEDRLSIIKLTRKNIFSFLSILLIVTIFTFIKYY
tara:strand:+ start:438 stop:632 length:195 start_codon:yes stop_codon:yes gene_type:complete